MSARMIDRYDVALAACAELIDDGWTSDAATLAVSQRYVEAPFRTADGAHVYHDRLLPVLRHALPLWLALADIGHVGPGAG